MKKATVEFVVCGAIVLVGAGLGVRWLRARASATASTLRAAPVVSPAVVSPAVVSPAAGGVPLEQWPVVTDQPPITKSNGDSLKDTFGTFGEPNPQSSFTDIHIGDGYNLGFFGPLVSLTTTDPSIFTVVHTQNSKDWGPSINSLLAGEGASKSGFVEMVATKPGTTTFTGTHHDGTTSAITTTVHA